MSAYLAVTESDSRHHVVQVDAECAALWRVVGTFPNRSDAVEFAGIKNGTTVPKSWAKLTLTEEQREAVVRRCLAGEHRGAVGEEFGLKQTQVDDLIKRWRAKERAQRDERHLLGEQPGTTQAAAGVVSLPEAEPAANPKARKIDGVPPTKTAGREGVDLGAGESPATNAEPAGTRPVPSVSLTSVGDNRSADAGRGTAQNLGRDQAEREAAERVGAPHTFDFDGKRRRFEQLWGQGTEPAEIAKELGYKNAASVISTANKWGLKRVKPNADQAAISAHIAAHGVSRRPTYGDPDVDALWAPLTARGHSLAKVPKGSRGPRQFILDNSTYALTKAELLSRAKEIITTEKPIREVAA